MKSIIEHVGKNKLSYMIAIGLVSTCIGIGILEGIANGFFAFGIGVFIMGFFVIE